MECNDTKQMKKNNPINLNYYFVHIAIYKMKTKI
ncbi:hypothetical protein SAMN05421768_10677 [Chryseobacterium joostei]|uniref:Uncharacterized protein n=1 Tax=Chryseobacterium joostei TaxID=112234 RepID=A0A1N7IMC0_9FLAO|nr:hypothetical protein SAMN05421768_10677 [Chryseobacterium joostei]